MSGFRGKFEKELKEKLLQKSNSKTTEEATLMKMFKFFDINDSGAVNLQEFVKAMEKIGLYYNEKQLAPLFQTYDRDGSGELDYQEFASIVFGSDGLSAHCKKKPDVTPESAKELVDAFRQKILQRGARSIIGIARVFKIMDDDNSKSLSLPEFTKAVHEVKLGITDKDIATLFKAFDLNNDGGIAYDEFLRQIKGEMNDFRKDLVRKAYKAIDEDGNGQLDYRDIADSYDAKHHPAVVEGRKTEKQVLEDFLHTFEMANSIKNGGQPDGIVTLEEFIEYYTNISANIDDDAYFAQMINSAWNLDKKAATYQKYKKGEAMDLRGKQKSGGVGYSKKNKPGPDG